ncbi:MAG: KTSC domain-containing protein [Thainema sp.]
MLQVEFQNGSVYQYQGVDADTWNALQAAESTGAFFNHEIKSTYRFQRVQPPPKSY